MKVTRRQLRRQLRRIIQEAAEGLVPAGAEEGGYTTQLMQQVKEKRDSKAGLAWWMDRAGFQFSSGSSEFQEHVLRTYFTTGLIIRKKDKAGLAILGKFRAEAPGIFNASKQEQASWVSEIVGDDGSLNQWRIKHDAKKKAEDEETSEDVYSPGDELPEDMQESRRLSRRFLKQMISKEILKSQKG